MWSSILVVSACENHNFENYALMVKGVEEMNLLWWAGEKFTSKRSLASIGVFIFQT